MKNILFATHNQHKKEEVQNILKNKCNLITFNDLNITEDIEETGKTFNENARIKSDFGFKKSNIPCFADDSGLVIEALNGQPGIFSARYSQTNTSEGNIQKVLKNMKNITNRKAYFICVISYSDSNGTHFFEGIINGKISENILGENGFGYDPIFVPEGYDISFAQMDLNLKNQISHRALALNKFMEFLK